MKRAYDRKNVSLEAKFFYGNTLSSCTIENISKNGMGISSEICSFLNSQIDLFILFKENVLTVPVKINRIVEDYDLNMLGAEVLNPTRKYFEFVDSVKEKQPFNTVLQVSAEALGKTKKCQSNFRCLTPETSKMCLIDKSVNGNGLFIKKRKKQKKCSYLLFLGYSHVCNCPIRYEIFERFNM